MSDDTYQNGKTFKGMYNTTLKVSHNYSEASRHLHPDSFLFFEVTDGGRNEYGTISKNDTRALRDYLNVLLDEEPAVVRPVLSDRAIDAMETLAHEMSVLDTASMADLAEALRKFNH